MGSLYQRGDCGGKAGNWIAEYTDHTGRRIKKSTKTRDKKAAGLILAKWEIDVAMRVGGVIDVAAERVAAQVRRPVTEHFEEWMSSLSAKDRDVDYLADVRSRWEKITEYCDWRILTDITAESFEAFIANLKKSKKSKKSELHRSQRTVGQYVQTAKGFTAYCVSTGRLPSNPLTTIKKPNPEVDRRHVRRMLLPDEWTRLAATVEQSGPVLDVPAAERRILYEVAIQTGLRSSELRSLIVASLELSARPHPFVVVGAKSTKNKNAAKQYITVDLAERWFKHLANHGRTGTDPAFQLCSKFNMAELLRRDCIASREAWIAIAEAKENEPEQKKRMKSDFLAVVNHSGETLDFHSLRHTCGAWLAIANVHPKTIQAVMRHSTITLTLDTYGHLMPGAEAGVIDKLSTMLGGSKSGSTEAH
jgi:integrase